MKIREESYVHYVLSEFKFNFFLFILKWGRGIRIKRVITQNLDKGIESPGFL